MATGGYVAAPKPGNEPIIQGGCGWPIDLTKQPISPAAAIFHMRGYTDWTPAERQQFLDDFAAAVARSARMRPGPGA